MAEHTSLDDINPQTDMVGKLHIGGESLHTDGAATQNLPPGFDEFAVTPRMRKEGAIQDSEALRWVRNSSMWEEHEKNDRIGQFQDTHDGRLVTRGKGGKPFTRGDLVLMAYPMAVKEAEEARELREAQEWQREIESGAHPENLPRDQDRLRALKERSRENNQRNGYVGGLSPTSGMRLEDAYRRFSADAVAAEETRYRRGPRGADREEIAQARAAAMEARGAQRAERAGKSVAMGNSGFPRNPNSPLAQAQARSAAGKK